MAAAIPHQIGKYRILRELGRGATSTVYLAEDAFHRREVAIKVVQPGPETDTELQRRYRRVFMNEASLAGRLSHPHIVSIYDAATRTLEWNFAAAQSVILLVGVLVVLVPYARLTGRRRG